MPRHTRKGGSKQQRKRAIPKLHIRKRAEARVLEVRGSWDAPGFEACVQAEMSEMTKAK